MSTAHIVVRQVIIYSKINLELVESEIIVTEYLAHEFNMLDWAQEEISNMGTDFLIETLDELKVCDGVYSVITNFSLSGGKDVDTPNGLGEYWSDCSPLYKPSVSRMDNLEEVQSLMEDHQCQQLEEDQIAILFSQKIPTELPFLIMNEQNKFF